MQLTWRTKPWEICPEGLEGVAQHFKMRVPMIESTPKQKTKHAHKSTKKEGGRRGNRKNPIYVFFGCRNFHAEMSVQTAKNYV